jgi:hypothetical protein
MLPTKFSLHLAEEFPRRRLKCAIIYATLILKQYLFEKKTKVLCNLDNIENYVW